MKSRKVKSSQKKSKIRTRSKRRHKISKKRYYDGTDPVPGTNTPVGFPLEIDIRKKYLIDLVEFNTYEQLEYFIIENFYPNINRQIERISMRSGFTMLDPYNFPQVKEWILTGMRESKIFIELVDY